jgi:hypothetical protein
VPTGNQCWTLFLNTANFKGPVAFFTPFFWSQATVENPEWAGLMLDSRPARPNKTISIETQYIPAILSTSTEGKVYARIAPISFAIGPDGCSSMLHRLTAYKKSALWDDVKRWFDGGPPSTGLIKPEASAVPGFRQGGGGSSLSIHAPKTPPEEKARIAWKSFATSCAPNPLTFCYRWNEQLTRKSGALVTLPDYYRLDSDGKKPQWSVVSPKDVPTELGLTPIPL